MDIAVIHKDGLAKAVDAAIDKNIAEGFTTGIQVLVSYDGELVYRRAAGLADREANCPMQENTLPILWHFLQPYSLTETVILSEIRCLEESITRTTMML